MNIKIINQVLTNIVQHIHNTLDMTKLLKQHDLEIFPDTMHIFKPKQHCTFMNGYEVWEVWLFSIIVNPFWVSSVIHIDVS